jgi:hypothetical protein
MYITRALYFATIPPIFGRIWQMPPIFELFSEMPLVPPSSVPNSQPAGRAVFGLLRLPRKPGGLFGLKKSYGRAGCHTGRPVQVQVEKFNFLQCNIAVVPRLHCAKENISFVPRLHY